MLALMKAELQPQKSAVDERELARLKRDYLPQWGAQRKSDRVGRGAPSDVPYKDYMKPHFSGSMVDPEDERPDPWVCRLIDAGIDELCGQRGMWHARAALAVRYISAGLPSVFRHGRLQAMGPDEAEELADEAERRLVPIVKRRGLPL